MEQTKLSIPAFLIALDGIGALLAALGFAEWKVHLGWVPEAWRFPHYAEAMLATGVLLMAPMIVYLIGRSRASSARNSGQSSGG